MAAVAAEAVFYEFSPVYNSQPELREVFSFSDAREIQRMCVIGEVVIELRMDVLGLGTRFLTGQLEW